MRHVTISSEVHNEHGDGLCAYRDATINPGKIRMAFAAAEFATPSIRTSIGAKWLIAFFAFPQLQTIRSFGKCGRDRNTLVPPSPPSEQNLWQTNRIQRDFLCSEPNRSNNVRCNICHLHTLNQRKFLQLFFYQRNLSWA